MQYHIIDVSEGININRTSESKEFMLCHYWYFNDGGLKFQPSVCNSCPAGLIKTDESKTLQY